MAPTRQQFCGDTVNIFGREDQNYHSNKASLQRPTTVTKQPKVLQTEEEVHPKIDSSHKLPVEKKEKKNCREAEEPEIESENMELDTDLDSIFCNLDQWETRFSIVSQWT
jgi:ribosome assembly protein YihI (activator of Der GTPase)